METVATQGSKSANKMAVGGSGLLSKYFLVPLKSGILGFTTFFTILLITKLLGYAIGTREVFVIDSEDILLSMVGFILVFLIRILENFKEK